MARNFFIFLFFSCWLWSITGAIGFSLEAMDSARILIAREDYVRAELLVKEAYWERIGISKSKNGVTSNGLRVFTVTGTVNGREEVMRVPYFFANEIRAMAASLESANGHAASIAVWYNRDMRNPMLSRETVRIAPYTSAFFDDTRRLMINALIGGYTPLLIMVAISIRLRMSAITRS